MSDVQKADSRLRRAVARLNRLRDLYGFQSLRPDVRAAEKSVDRARLAYLALGEAPTVGNGPYKLTICRCPHGVESICLDHQAAGIRLTGMECCGRWQEVKAFGMTQPMLQRAAEEFAEAAAHPRTGGSE